MTRNMLRFVLPLLFIIVFSSLADNNMSRLVLSIGEAGREVRFSLPQDDWIHIKTGQGAERSFRLVDNDGRVSSSTLTDGEGFVELRAGSYTLLGNYGDSIRIRAVPMTMFFSLAGVDYNAPVEEAVRIVEDKSSKGRPGMYLYNWKWLRKNILNPFNTIAGASSIPEVFSWCEEGRNCVNTSTAHKTEGLFEHWKSIMDSQPHKGGIMADEYIVPVIKHSADDKGDEQLGYINKGAGFTDYSYDCIRRFAKEYPGSRFYAWVGVPWDADTADSKPLLDILIENDGIIAWEFYANTSYRHEHPMARHEVRTRGFLKARPDFMRHAMLCPGTYEYISMDPSCDFKVWIDESLYMFANDPRFNGLRGIGMWAVYYTDPELLRWYSSLLRHYCIEGRTDKFSDLLGFKLDPDILKDSDFAQELKPWTVNAAEEGSVFVKKSTELPFKKSYQPYCDQVLCMKHVPGKVNSVSQRLSNLVPGNRYVLKTEITEPGVTEKTKYAFGIELENCTIEQCLVRDFRDFLPKNNPQFFNTYTVLFRYNGGDCVLTVSDKASEGQVQAKDLVIDGISVTPYFEE